MRVREFASLNRDSEANLQNEKRRRGNIILCEDTRAGFIGISPTAALCVTLNLLVFSMAVWCGHVNIAY